MKIPKKHNKDNYNKFVRERNKKRQDKHDKLRTELANIYLSGIGIEIGALHKPLNVPEGRVQIRYVDRLKTKDLRLQYPEVDEPIVEVDIIDDGETLRKIRSNSLNFVIANHFYEHCANPLQALGNILRVIKSGGSLFMAIPDKRFTFDASRKATSFKHLVNDFKDGSSSSKHQHFDEWIRKVEKEDKDKYKSRMDELLKINYSIHYHVWDYESLAKHFFKARKYLAGSFDVLLVARNYTENIVLLKKN